MTEQEILKRDIDGLRESINLGWREMAEKTMTREERVELRKHINWLIDELKQLLERLDA
jgi:hypothetical protein